MADVVQYRLERMADELDDLERRGVFTRQEIAEIVKLRRKFEYRLKRPSPLKQDYLAYIEYETQLDSLRRLRKKVVEIELKKQGKKKKMKKSVSDFAGVSRIIEIYRLAVTRYKGDIDLWFRYLEFCRERKNGRMKKVLAQLVRFHPKVPGVWIYAAAWEFDHNTNVHAARSLMLNGLRVCPTSEDLWVEYLRMELTYLNKLKARKVALGEDEGSLARDSKILKDKQWRDENLDLFMPLGEDREENDVSSLVDEDSNKKLDLFREQGLIMLQTIYSGAVKALPSSFGLRKRFLEILEATDVAHSEEMHKEILDDMKRDFSADPEYWDWLARLESAQERSEELKLSQIEKAVKVYEEALKFVPSVMMFSLYTKFFMDFIVPQKEENQNSKITSHVTSHLLMVYEKAETMGFFTEDLGCQHISVLLQLGKLDDAKKLAENLCSGSLSKSVKLWLLRVSIEIKCCTRESSSPSNKDLQSIFGLLKKILPEVSISEAESLWLLALKFFVNRRHYFDKLVDISLISLTKYGGSEDGFCLPSAVVSFALQNDGIQHARDMYKRYLAIPHPGLTLYRKCIELESDLACVGDRDGLANSRKLYESALTTYNQNVSLWRDYYSLERKMGSSETATAVHWRARKILKDADTFVTSSDPL